MFVEVNIMAMKKLDLKVEYTKGSGPGGQHKNKVETCVTITHIPTGISQRSQDTRSRSRNYNLAWSRLNCKVKEQRDALKKEQEDIIRHSLNTDVIRTYNYARNEVKDHRTGEKHNLKQFMDGKVRF